MHAIQERTTEILGQTLHDLQRFDFLSDFAIQFETLLSQVPRPCVVAVAGRVKAGKSSFINALLREDLAQVGTVETTATINYFTYGTPDADRPIRCHWRAGSVTTETVAFLTSLQGNDEETLRRAADIRYLEYVLPNNWLREVTLVDTPGTGAAVEEHHDRTLEYLQLHSSLREMHHSETVRLTDTADGIIYLVGPVATASDKELLDEFTATTGSATSPFNSIGVISKIDLYPTALDARFEIAARVGNQLQHSLNAVIPVSSAIQRTLDRLHDDDSSILERMAADFAQIPPEQARLLLSSDQLFRTLAVPGLTMSTDERSRMVDEIPWAALRVICQLCAECNGGREVIVEELRSIGGFDELRTVLDRYFVQRSSMLKCYRILRDARRLLASIRYHRLPREEQRQAERRGQLERFHRVIEQSHEPPELRDELKTFLETQFTDIATDSQLEGILKRSEREIARLFHDLDQHNADFGAVQQMGTARDLFDDDEFHELGALLGLRGMDSAARLGGESPDKDYVRERQRYWLSVRDQSVPGSVRHHVAARAFSRYGLILSELLKSN